MKILSIRAPWWWWIFHGGKGIENRPWRYDPSYRGPVAIQVSKWFVPAQVVRDTAAAHVMARASGTKLPGLGFGPALDDLRAMCGHIVGTVDLVDTVRASHSPWYTGELGLVLRNPRRLSTPIPFKAQLGLFQAPPVLTELVKQIGRKAA